MTAITTAINIQPTRNARGYLFKTWWAGWVSGSTDKKGCWMKCNEKQHAWRFSTSMCWTTREDFWHPVVSTTVNREIPGPTRLFKILIFWAPSLIESKSELQESLLTDLAARVSLFPTVKNKRRLYVLVLITPALVMGCSISPPAESRSRQELSSPFHFLPAPNSLTDERLGAAWQKRECKSTWFFPLCTAKPK